MCVEERALGVPHEGHTRAGSSVLRGKQSMLGQWKVESMVGGSRSEVAGGQRLRVSVSQASGEVRSSLGRDVWSVKDIDAERLLFPICTESVSQSQ